MEKCDKFVNGHCSFHCPNFAVDEFESRYDCPASDIGLTRIDCGDCMYTDSRCTCTDCYFRGSDGCPKGVCV